MFKILRNFQTLFQSGCTVLQSPPTMNMSSKFSTSYILVIVCLFDYGHLSECEVVIYKYFLINTNPSPSLCPSVMGRNSNSVILGTTELCQEEKNPRIWLRAEMTRRECSRNVRVNQTGRVSFLILDQNAPNQFVQ